MAWYYGTYSCGHEGRVNVIGPAMDRQWKIDKHFEGLCQECYEKKKKEERERENEEAAEKTAEMELPELTGTEKQVSWANTLRIKVIEAYERRVEKAKGKASDSEIEESALIMDYAIKNHTDARFWIDTRDDSKIFRRFVQEYREHQEKEEIPEEVAEELEQEAQSLTVSPDMEDKKNGVAVISFNEKESIVSLEYAKDDKFREIVKSLGYKWGGEYWEKNITEYTGRMEDLAAEIGNKLLLSGFTVHFPNAESKQKAISADFQPENDRWVMFNIKTSQLALVWKKRSDTLYENAKKLPSARWKDGSMRVNIEYYREVQDFAETMGFSISKMAQYEIAKFEKKESVFEKADVSAPCMESLPDKERISKSLKSGGTIIEDLRDDA